MKKNDLHQEAKNVLAKMPVILLAAAVRQSY
jgi:hypothetical protein